jgi:hypothetical protein
LRQRRLDQRRLAVYHWGELAARHYLGDGASMLGLGVVGTIIVILIILKVLGVF